MALRPPMGWNSFDGFGSSVTEVQFRENVDFIAEHLKPFGWEYAVVDYCWSHPDPGAVENPHVTYDDRGRSRPSLAMDDHGRLIPAVERFPSAKNGAGFRPLADYVHSRGLKFGIHVMRGIPREAVHRDLPVAGSDVSANSIGDRHSKCRWLNHMYGIDMRVSGAQAYYDSILQLYAGWGVDFIKADDLTNLHVHPELDPKLEQYAAAEIEGLSRAIAACGRSMVFSVSVGPTPLARAGHVATYANMWRVSADFWDRWSDLVEMFYYMRAWSSHRGPGRWPDADMIPFGRLSKRGPNGPERTSRFTNDEKTTLFALWSISRSPLMLGGNLPEYDGHSLAVVTNPDLIAINQTSSNNREVYNDGETVVWTADLPCGRQPVAVFNLANADRAVRLSACGVNMARERVRDAMNGGSSIRLGCDGEIDVPSHGARVIEFDRGPAAVHGARSTAARLP